MGDPTSLFPKNYLLTLLLHNAALSGLCWLLGKWVVRRGVKVNYTRKLNHLALFLIPIGLAPLLPYAPSPWTISASAAAFLVTTLVFAEPVRSRVPAVATAFASVDRPEDRPHTLTWIVTQAMAAYAVLVLVFAWLSWCGRPDLVAVPLLVTGIGDGLAEPVGVRFGRHRYRVPSLAAGRAYVRSLEGSACVFLTAVVTVACFAGSLSGPQLLALLVLVPAVMTAAEAVSPHAWDAPILYLVGGGTVAGVLTLIPV